MKGVNSYSEAPATPDQILGIFRDWQRMEWGKALEKDQLLAFTTTVIDWRSDCELKNWHELGRELNKFFGVYFSKAEWRSVMLPERKKTLLDVVSLIATRAKLPKTQEITVLGKPCKTASSFFALLSSLRSVGIDTKGVRPSVSLGHLLRTQTKNTLEAIVKLAPGKMPEVNFELNLGERVSGWFCLVGFVAMVFGGISGNFQWMLVSGSVFVIALIAIMIFSEFPPAKVSLEGIETFADLSCHLAGVEPKKLSKLRHGH